MDPLADYGGGFEYGLLPNLVWDWHKKGTVERRSCINSNNSFTRMWLNLQVQMWNNKHFLKSELTSSTSFNTFVCFRFVSPPMVVRLFEDLVPQRRNLTMQSCLFVILTFPDPSGCHVENRKEWIEVAKRFALFVLFLFPFQPRYLVEIPVPIGFLLSLPSFTSSLRSTIFAGRNVFRRVWKPFAATLDKGFVVQQIALG